MDRILKILLQAQQLATSLPFAEGTGWPRWNHATHASLFGAEFVPIIGRLQALAVQEALGKTDEAVRIADTIDLIDLETKIKVVCDKSVDLGDRWRSLIHIKDVVSRALFE